MAEADAAVVATVVVVRRTVVVVMVAVAAMAPHEEAVTVADIALGDPDIALTRSYSRDNGRRQEHFGHFLSCGTLSGVSV